MSLRAVDLPEESLNFDYFDEDIEAEAKWNNWPTNATQNQKLFFDIAFEMFGEAN